jgi:hypothetical protein
MMPYVVHLVNKLGGISCIIADLTYFKYVAFWGTPGLDQDA